MSPRVSLLGGPGAFSEEATRSFFGTAWTPVFAPTFQEVAAAPGAGLADIAVLPVENSIAGIVEDACEAWRASRLLAFDELALPVKQCLLALPGVRLEEVKEVWSHPHALAQCVPFLRQHGIHAFPTSSTSAGAERVFRDQLRHQGALGSERTAERWGLSVLASDVQSVASNFTRFVALARESRATPSSNDKTTVVLEPKGSAAGLSAIVEVLKARGVGLLRLASRPVATRPWHQAYYLDLAGNAQDPSIQAALPVVERLCDAFQWLGSYPARV